MPGCAEPRPTVVGVTTSTTGDALAAAYERRQAAVDDTSVGGREYCHRLAAATDAWIAELAAHAREQHPRGPKFALVAVGGYGRGELSPQSDIDLLLVHDSKSNRIEPVASAIWYPIWDRGLKLGHAVRSVDEHLALAKTDLDTATALLTAATDRRRPQARRHHRRVGPEQLDQAQEAVARRTTRQGPSAPDRRRGCRLHPRTRSQGRARRHP